MAAVAAVAAVVFVEKKKIEEMIVALLEQIELAETDMWQPAKPEMFVVLAVVKELSVVEVSFAFAFANVKHKALTALLCPKRLSFGLAL